MKNGELDRYLAALDERAEEPRDAQRATQLLLEAQVEHARAMRDQAQARDVMRAVHAEIAELLARGMTDQEAVNYLQGRDAAAHSLAAVNAKYRELLEATMGQEALSIGAQPWLASAEMRKQAGVTAGQRLPGVKEIKASPIELKVDEGTARFSGLASPFLGQPDAVGDIVQPGAYTRTLAEAEAQGQKYLLPVLWAHDTKQPLGGIITAVERPDGLHVEGELAVDTELGKYAASLLQKRMVSGLSIGFIARRDKYVGSVRHLLDIQLLEISIVVLPAAPLARVTNL